MGAHTYGARVAWRRNGAVFTDNRYSRGHEWSFDGGTTVPASASPLVVREPLSVAAAVDPEEAFVAAASSCHMLWFLSIAAKRGFTVESYTDDASGVMEKNAEGRVAITTITLHPKVEFTTTKLPTADELAKLHHDAHEECYIANSIRSEIRIVSG